MMKGFLFCWLVTMATSTLSAREGYSTDKLSIHHPGALHKNATQIHHKKKQQSRQKKSSKKAVNHGTGKHIKPAHPRSPASRNSKKHPSPKLRRAAKHNSSHGKKRLNSTNAYLSHPKKKRAYHTRPARDEEVIAVPAEPFAICKGSLPWPVENASVKIPYGKYKLEGQPINGDNPGLTIVTPNAGSPVKAVFDGEVADVYPLGDGTLGVTVRHGKYLTTYSNLNEVSVAKNDTVQTAQVLGKAGQEEDGNGGLIEFIIMFETNTVNPAYWLHK